MIPLPNEYFKPHKNGGFELTKSFYEQGLHSKYEIITPFLPDLDTKTFNRVVDAILQHSSLESRKNFPVLFVRKLSKVAKLADLAYQKEVQFA